MDMKTGDDPLHGSPMEEGAALRTLLGRTNRDWWPNQLSLEILSQHGATGDPAPGDPAVLYWFKLVRHADHSVDFIPHLIDHNSGVGTQVVAVDLNGDKLLDVVVGNKKGAFVHLQAKPAGASR